MRRVSIIFLEALCHAPLVLIITLIILAYLNIFQYEHQLNAVNTRNYECMFRTLVLTYILYRIVTRLYDVCCPPNFIQPLDDEIVGFYIFGSNYFRYFFFSIIVFL